MLLSVCIPVFNESAAVRKCAENLTAFLDGFCAEYGCGYEIVFCDDGSTDGCRRIAESLAAEKKEIRVIGYEDNRGKGSAVREAMLAAKGDIRLFTDCDLAYGTEPIKDAVLNMVSPDGSLKSDVLVGTRNKNGDGYNGYSFFRKAASKIYIKILSVVGGLRLSDSQCGFKVFSALSAKRIFSLCTCNSFAFDFEVISVAEKLGLKISEMPVTVVNHSDSKVHVIRDSFGMLLDVVKIRKRVRKLKTD